MMQYSSSSAAESAEQSPLRRIERAEMLQARANPAAVGGGGTIHRGCQIDLLHSRVAWSCPASLAGCSDPSDLVWPTSHFEVTSCLTEGSESIGGDGSSGDVTLHAPSRLSTLSSTSTPRRRKNRGR